MHELKVWPAYFDALARGTKAFELRRNDRDYREGDVLHLREWDPTKLRYTGSELLAGVAYVLLRAAFTDAHGKTSGGLEEGYAVLGLGWAHLVARGVGL